MLVQMLVQMLLQMLVQKGQLVVVVGQVRCVANIWSAHDSIYTETLLVQIIVLSVKEC